MNKNKRPGRPPSKNPASRRIVFRVTPEQEERYKRAAAKAEKKVSAWLKAIADEKS